MAVDEACGGAYVLILRHYCASAEPSIRVSTLAWLNLTRIGCLRHAEDLVHFAQLTEVELRGKNIGRDAINAVYIER